MPDLGMPHNVLRARGGFFTGAFYEWTSDAPFVPVDATVNCCSVSVFPLSRRITDETHFQNRIFECVGHSASHGKYQWNFESGNHFVTYAEARNSDGSLEPFVVLHSSAAEFKNQAHGLYPTPGCWYWNSIKREDHDDGRYLRYIEGRTAEMFINIAKALIDFNRERHKYFAETMFGHYGVGEALVTAPHYGMPADNCVAIGCQWRPERFLLLTAPWRTLYLIQPEQRSRFLERMGKEDYTLTPHGLGVKFNDPAQLSFTETGIRVGNQQFATTSSLCNFEGLDIRIPKDDSGLEGRVGEVLEKCPGTIEKRLEPVFSYFRTPASAQTKAN